MCCASTRRDDTGQWRLYADNARGYAIELDPAQPLGVLARTDAFPDHKAPEDLASRPGVSFDDVVDVSLWIKVIYSGQDKRTALAEFLGAASADYQSIHSLTGIPDKEGEALAEGFDQDLAGISTLAQCMKTQAFEGECEVRTVVASLLDAHSHFRATEYG